MTVVLFKNLESTMRKSVLAISLLVTGSVFAAEPSVAFTVPQNGATVTSPFSVGFSVSGMYIKPAGDMTPNTGHHHLLINSGSVTKGVAIPMDTMHLHYSQGQTNGSLTLPPGKYQLTLQFGDGAHRSYGPAMSNTIQITVK
jgi:hypothetical protein